MYLGHKGLNYVREEVVHGEESAREENNAFRKDMRFASVMAQITILYKATCELGFY
jgi:hypothetical protein